MMRFHFGKHGAAVIAGAITLACPALADDATTPPSAAAGAQAVPDFGLHDQLGHFHRLRYYSKDPETKAFVLFTQANGCPLVRKRVRELNRLQETYAPKGIRFWMLNASPQDSREEIAREAAEFGIRMPVLIDTTQLLAESLGVRRTAEAIVIEANSWKVLYRGAVSDRLDYESDKREASHNYLANALDSFLAGKPIARSRTDAPGCLVTLIDADAKKHRETSYSDTIAPLLKNRCVHCHSEGGIGPFAMSSYGKVRGWSDMIEEVILTGRMPPWQADPHFGSFANDFSLTEPEQRALVHWIRAGAPRGDGPDPLSGYRPELPDWKLGKPDSVINIGEQSVPAEGVLEYRYVFVDSPFDKDVWIRAVDVRPGNTRVLHHVIATSVIQEKGKDRERALAGYAPGMGPDQFPNGTAILLRKGSRIKFQLHYTVSGKPEIDAARLGLYLAKEPVRQELHSQVVIDQKFRIPAGAREFEASRTNRFSRDILLYSMNPHMHYRGKSMRYEAHYPDGKKEVLLSVPRYHFNWQRAYKLKEPKLLPKGTELVVYAVWDNSELNHDNPDPTREVTWGEQTFDEMFFASYTYTHAGQDLTKLAAKVSSD